MKKNDFLAIGYGSPNTHRRQGFMRWLESKECERYWDKDENGEKVILRSGWDRAYEEYNRIKGLKEKTENDLKVCGTLCHRE